MNYLEPCQFLKFYLNTKGDRAVYIQSSITVLLEEKTSLVAREPVTFNKERKATIDYDLKYNESVRESGSFEYTKLIRITDSLPLPEFKETSTLVPYIQKEVISKYGRIFDFTVACIVHNKNGGIGGQATNTINQDGQVIII